MRKTYIGLFAAVIVFMGPSSIAQQQTVPPQDIINQQGSSFYQNNAGSERYRSQDITENVGNSDVLNNAQVQQLQVVGAPATSPSSTQDSPGIAMWVLLAAGILLVLLAPALLYTRDIRRKVSTAHYVETEENSPEEDVSTSSADQEQATVTKEAPASQESPKKSKKKNKKTPHSKSKRSKKKKK